MSFVNSLRERHLAWRNKRKENKCSKQKLKTKTNIYLTIEVTNDYVSRANTYDASTQNSGALNYLCLEAIN